MNEMRAPQKIYMPFAPKPNLALPVLKSEVKKYTFKKQKRRGHCDYRKSLCQVI